MSITLVAVVVALVLGHVAPGLVTAARQHEWYGRWLGWLDGRLAEDTFWHGRYGLIIALAPVLLLVALFQLALDAPLLGLAGMLFSVLVLAYSWGPRDLDVDVEAVIEAHDLASRRAAVAHLYEDAAVVRDGGIVGGDGLAIVRMEGASLVDAVFRSGLRRWFGVLLWFLVLGPAGALLYRLVALAAVGPLSRTLPVQNATGARWVLAVLEWPVAQLMTLAMALVGNFDAVFGAWRAAGGPDLSLSSGFLSAAARASVGSELEEEGQEFTEGLAPPLAGRSGRFRRGRAAGAARRHEPGVAHPVVVVGPAGPVRDRRLGQLAEDRVRRRWSSGAGLVLDRLRHRRRATRGPWLPASPR